MKVVPTFTTVYIFLLGMLE